MARKFHRIVTTQIETQAHYSIDESDSSLQLMYSTRDFYVCQPSNGGRKYGYWKICILCLRTRIYYSVVFLEYLHNPIRFLYPVNSNFQCSLPSPEHMSSGRWRSRASRVRGSILHEIVRKYSPNCRWVNDFADYIDSFGFAKIISSS